MAAWTGAGKGEWKVAGHTGYLSALPRALSLCSAGYEGSPLLFKTLYPPVAVLGKIVDI